MKKLIMYSFTLVVLLGLAINPSISLAARATPDWHVEEASPNDAPLQDPMMMYNAGGVDGAVAIIGQPSMRTYRHILVGVDLHEPVFSGSNAGSKNGTPDGKYLYVNDKGANTIGVINLQTSFMERIIGLPFPFGIHHISMSPDGKFLFATGELTGKMGKVDIASGKTMVIDVPPAPSAPDYLDVTKDGKFVFSGNYYHSTTMVFSTDPFKLIKEIPVGKNPHGHDITADNKYVLVSDKLSSTMTIIDIAKQAVKKVIPTGAGPLHTVVDVHQADGKPYMPKAGVHVTPDKLMSKYAYESCFVADAVVKVDLNKLEVVDEYPVHYRIGHINISADNSYVTALNKFSTGLFSPSGIIYPVNFEMIDVRENSKTYGKTLKITPVDGEPHNAKSIFATFIKDWTMGQAEEAGLLKKATPALHPMHKGLSKVYYMPKDTEKAGIVQKGDVKEVHVRGFSYGYVPRNIRVNKGDKVRIIYTNIDKAAGLTKNPDVTMGFTIHGIYGMQTNIAAPRGVSVVTEFVADIAGEYEFYCQHFCGPLHLEMRGTFFVDGPKGPSSLAVGDYDEAMKYRGLLPAGEKVETGRAEKL